MAQMLFLIPSPPSSSSPTRCYFPYLQPPGLYPITRAPLAFKKDRFSSLVSGSQGNRSSRWVSSSASPTDGYIASEVTAGGGGDGAGSYGGRSGGGGSEGGGGFEGEREGSGAVGSAGLLGAFVRGWQDRVKADPQFPFKVLMEEVVGVSACVIGDMASRPNFGLNELDFVFSTVVVGCILNFTLMFMLAPTSAVAAASSLPSVFAGCPPAHMFEPGVYTALERLGTFVYKGALFATVGFAAGLLGTFTSNSLIAIRKKMDPTFYPQNKPPPTVLNATTWAIHMGLSSNLRYQALNGIEFGMAKFLPPAVFRVSLFATRGLNNILGGMTFVALARLTGSQKIQEPKESEVGDKTPSSPTEDNEPTVAK